MLHLLFTFPRIYQSVVGSSVDCRPGHAGGDRNDRPCQGGCANPQEWIGRFPWFVGKKASRRIGLGKLMNWYISGLADR